MEPCSDRSKKILTIPNLLSAFRLVLAGVFAYIYWNARGQHDYNLAVGVLVLSALTSVTASAGSAEKKPRSLA